MPKGKGYGSSGKNAPIKKMGQTKGSKFGMDPSKGAKGKGK